MRRILPAGTELIKKFEGCRLIAYQDQAGIWTIGYGHTRGVKPGDTCTQAQADQWLVEDLDLRAEGPVDTATADVPTGDNQFSALCSLCFNIGAGNFEQSTALSRHRAGDFQDAANAILMWDEISIDGVRQKDAGLLARRQAERALYLTPDAAPSA